MRQPGRRDRSVVLLVIADLGGTELPVLEAHHSGEYAIPASAGMAMQLLFANIENLVPRTKSEITGYAAKDKPEYWSAGVLDVIEPEVDKPRFRQSIAVIIGSVNVFEQNKLS